MSDEPRKPWRECKAIAQALYPKSQAQNVEQVKDKLQAAILAQLASLGPDGASLAGRLANAPVGCPINGQPGDLQVLEQLNERRTAMGIDGQTAVALDLDRR
jgi:hypothetical protein